MTLSTDAGNAVSDAFSDLFGVPILIASTGAAAAGSFILSGAIEHANSINASILSVAGTGTILFSLAAFVKTAVEKIFDAIGWKQDFWRSCAEWSFTIIYSAVIALAAANGFGLASTISEALVISMIVLRIISGALMIAPAVYMWLA